MSLRTDVRLSLIVSGLVATILTAGCRRHKDEEVDSTSQIAEALVNDKADMPETLAATNLFDSGDPSTPSNSLVSYEIRVPLWSDGADKKRYLYLPAGAKITYNKTEKRFDFPAGTTFVKHFRSGAEANSSVEMRLLTLKSDGVWRFANYVFDDAQSTHKNDRPVTVTKDDTPFRVPSDKECKQCHNESKPVLGFEPAQLKLDKGDSSVLKSLIERGLVDMTAEDVEAVKALPDTKDKSLSNEDRALSYMHVNCGSCHNPTGPKGADDYDLRFSSLDNGLKRKGKIIAGDVEKNPMWDEISGKDERMPPLVTRPDPLALELVRQYITDHQK